MWNGTYYSTLRWVFPSTEQTELSLAGTTVKLSFKSQPSSDCSDQGLRRWIYLSVNETFS